MDLIDQKLIVITRAVDEKGFESSAEFFYQPEHMDSPLEIWLMANRWLKRMYRNGHQVFVQIGKPQLPPF